MFLKRISLRGFKSFADKTIVNFDDGLTIIVGPNGSGKSNINDAIKWVLGESSKKNLRASSSSDMIFNGTSTERKADYAEVTLLFNNEEKILDINYREVSVTRRSYRDENEPDEYFINKSRVRKRDIRDLFMDTGLGNTDLSIISQSNVTKIAESKPDDLRLILNETAGVAKYQIQKNESIRKLERVNQNLEIFNVKLTELKKVVDPLRKQAEKAKKYLEIKKELEKIELSLIKEILKIDIEEKELLSERLNKSNEIKNNSKNRIDNLKIKINEIHNKLLILENDLNKLQNQQQQLSTAISRKTSSSEEAVDFQIKKTFSDLSEIKEIQKENALELEKKSKNLNIEKENRIKLLESRDKNKYRLNAIEYELNKYKSNQNLSKGTEIILQNKNIFNGVHGILFELLSINSKYELAMEVSLGNILKNIIVENEETIKEAIYFLKENKYGTATFMPVQETKPNDISTEIDGALQNLNGYIGTLSSLINSKPIYQNIISSISGKILVFDNIENGLNAAKYLNHKYKIVSIDGDIIFPGFVVKGGYNKRTNNNSTRMLLKNEKEKVTNYLNKIDSLYKHSENNIEELQIEVSTFERKKIRLDERKTYLELSLENYLRDFKEITGIDYDISSFESHDIKKVDGLSLEKLNSLINEKQDLKSNLFKQYNDLRTLEEEIRSKWMIAVEEASSDEIKFDRLNIKINKELGILNKEYKLTFDALLNKETEKLNGTIEENSDIRNDLREKITSLGYINVDSIAEYEKVGNDYETLQTNTNDLIESKDKLLSTISKMDKIMEKQFSENFEKVQIKFNEVFKILFRGGEAKLLLEDPENILETGILIRVQPPGKAKNSMRLLSGGEKSLTALSLVFAMNLVRSLPLLILDEPEAALDEANVERFAKFAKSLNDHSQVIVTTHRPGTMELADVIYGVTMQKKGITKIVTVKLETAMEMTK